jgi:hypothetical protein
LAGRDAGLVYKDNLCSTGLVNQPEKQIPNPGMIHIHADVQVYNGAAAADRKV